MKMFYSLLAMIITAPFVVAQDLGDPGCDSLILVSSWRANNVKIYDGCNGEYIRDLADSGVLRGPQAIFQDPQGDVVVVSESNHKLVKFDLATLSQATTVVSPGLMSNPITVVKKDDNHVYLGSYSSNEIIELNTQNWQKVRTVLPASKVHIEGIDIGMTMGPDGHLYVPGYDSDNILRVNPNNGNSNEFVSAGSNGLDRPRSVLFVGNQMWVTDYGNSAVASYGMNGQFQNNVISDLFGVAGMIKDGPDHILVTSDYYNDVRRYNINDLSYETVVERRSGGLIGATSVYRLNKQVTEPELTDVTGMRQAWLNGVGIIQDNQILVTEFATTLGGAFGTDFSPEGIETILWGELLIEFTDCHHAEMSYTSTLSVDGIAFGTGSYPVSRIAMNLSGRLCEDSGFDNTNNNQWMSGTFYGGATRSGEGFNIDVLENNRVIVSWYTYLPENQ